MIFTINATNQINLLDAMPASDAPMPDGTVLIGNSKDLTAAGMNWPISRLVELWNNLAPRVGLKPVAKFENRTKAVLRLWRAIEALANHIAGKKLATELNADNHDYDQKIEAIDGRRRRSQPDGAVQTNTSADGMITSAELAAASVEAPSDLAACPGPGAKKGKKAKAAKAPRASKPARAAKPAAAGEPKAPREGTAKATVLAMIQRKGGATLQEIMEATGWQAHTCRGFMSVAPKKAGLEVVSTRRESDKARVYEVAR